MEKNKTNAATGIEKERELTAEELEKVLGGAMDTQQMDEKTTASSVLAQLMDRNGKAMGIEETDNVTMSFVVGGKTFTTTVAAKDLTFSELAGKSFCCGTDTVTGASVDFTKTKE